MTEAALESGLRVRATATNATLSVATITGVAGQKVWITNFSASSDKAGSIILVKSGTTVIWQDIVGVGNYIYPASHPIVSNIGEDVSVTIDSTAKGCANIVGVQL